MSYPYQPDQGDASEAVPYQAQPWQEQAYGQVPAPTAPPKSPGVAVILSVLLPGAGHLYSGNPVAAVVWFVAAAIAYATLGILIGFLLVPLVYIGACIHAYLTTQSFNVRHHVVR